MREEQIATDQENNLDEMPADIEVEDLEKSAQKHLKADDHVLSVGDQSFRLANEKARLSQIQPASNPVEAQEEVAVESSKKSMRFLVVAFIFIMLAGLTGAVAYLLVTRQTTEVSEPVIDLSAYTRKIPLDTQQLFKLNDRPEAYATGDRISAFEIVLPEEFIEVGNPQVKYIEGWYDAINLEGIRFTFTNGEEDFATEVFGRTEDRKGAETSYKLLEVDEPITSIQRLMINTKITPDQEKHSGWAIVNFGINGKADKQVGYDDSALSYAIKDRMSDTLDENQRIVGLHGFIDNESGVLRSASFILAGIDPTI